MFKFFKYTLVIVSYLSLMGCVTVDKDGNIIETDRSKSSLNSEIYTSLNEYKGEYRDLNFERIENYKKKILGSDIDTIKEVMNDPNNFEPPILFVYAEQVFLAGHRDVGMFWYYTAQLRARSDANKSLDKSVQKAVTELSIQHGQYIGKFAYENPSLLKDVMDKVLEWDKISERKYNPKWVALLGNEAKFSDTIRFVDESKYESINNEVRRGWKQGFDTAIQQIEKSHHDRE
ncbi:MAG: hypothetical protein ACI4V7_02765 [Succinivibrionaceae bacterium]